MKSQLFQNEYIMAPLKLGYCHDKDGKVNQRHLDFYAQRTDLGAIIPEPLYIDSGLRENPMQLGIDSDDKLSGLRDLAETIHSTGASFIAHLNHPGRMAHPALPGNYHWSASAEACPNGGALPLPMDEAKMAFARQKLVEAAVKAEKAGADGVEVQFGYGYLFAQFLSPKINKREDQYGGSLENRMRFPLETLQAIQNAIEIPVMVRLSATDMEPDGIGLEESIKLSKRLEAMGVAALHISVGSACSSPAWYYQHMFVPKGKNWELAAAIQKEVKLPVFFHGRIHSAEDIQLLKQKFDARYFAIGRALVADQHMVSKLLGNSEEPVRPCLACSEACLGGVKAGKGLGCVVNLTVNTSYPAAEEVKTKKRIAVVGGGLAGMEAAIRMSDRGHEVVLFEENQLGGQFTLAWLPPKKESLEEIVSFYKKQLERLSVEVRKQKADATLLEAEQFDEVVMATGSRAFVPPIPGLKDFVWAEILEKERLPEEQKVVIIGGGLIGIEVAVSLVEKDNQVIIVEMLDEVARGLEMIERKMSLEKLKQKHAQILTSTRVVAVEGNTLKLESASGEKMTIVAVDLVVVATGMKAYRPFESSLPTHWIGDANKVGKAEDAIKSAYELALTI
jgi:2,4-dienoyl-CoA reductase-like NADH-dependent reductase (Old Yellow Enzyme family)/thioredoxin reductase